MVFIKQSFCMTLKRPPSSLPSPKTNAFSLYNLLIIIVVTGTGWPLRCLLLNTNRAALAGEMSGSLGSPGPGLELDTVTVEAVPQKKGIILRHVEYTVKYSTQYSAVHRQVGSLPLRGDQAILRLPGAGRPPALQVLGVLAFFGNYENFAKLL